MPGGHEGDDEEQEVFSADPHAPGQPTLQLIADELNFEEGTDEETEAGVEAKTAPAPVEEDDETKLFEQAAGAEVKPTKGKKNKKVDDGRQGLLWAA